MNVFRLARKIRLRCALLAALAPLAFSQRYSFKQYDGPEGLGNLATLCLLQDSTGYLWVGTQHGLFRWDGARFLRFDVPDGLPSPRIESMYETPDHVLWVGTSAGLARRQGARFASVDVGRPVEIAGRSAMASDAAGRFYLGTSTGLLIGMPTSNGLRFAPGPKAPGDQGPVHSLHSTVNSMVGPMPQCIARSWRAHKPAEP